ncbi:MAG: hypothetical protein WCJ33_01910, partial [Pseudomonadota bacterium]
PPAQAVLILISHNPGSLLPTIRSRCRMLKFSELAEEEFNKIMADIAPEIDLYDYDKWALLSGNSPGIALNLYKLSADKIYEELLEFFLGSNNISSLHSFADRFSSKDNEKQWQMLKRLILWLIARIASASGGISHEVFKGEMAKINQLATAKNLYFWTELWEKAGNIFSETDRLYLDKKQAIITIIRSVTV